MERAPNNSPSSQLVEFTAGMASLCSFPSSVHLPSINTILYPLILQKLTQIILYWSWVRSQRKKDILLYIKSRFFHFWWRKTEKGNRKGKWQGDREGRKEEQMEERERKWRVPFFDSVILRIGFKDNRR